MAHLVAWMTPTPIFVRPHTREGNPPSRNPFEEPLHPPVVRDRATQLNRFYATCVSNVFNFAILRHFTASRARKFEVTICYLGKGCHVQSCIQKSYTNLAPDASMCQQRKLPLLSATFRSPGRHGPIPAAGLGTCCSTHHFTT